MTHGPSEGPELARLLSRLDELRQAERRAASARMVSVIGHLIGTPLNVIAGRAALMRSNPSAGAVEENLRRIEEQVERLSLRIRRLIDYFGVQDAPVEARSVSEILHECEKLYGPVAEHRGVRLTLASAEVGEHLLEGSFTPLVLTALLSLAIRGAPSGSQVELRASERGPATLVIEIACPGLEPPPCRLDRLEPPQQGERYDASALETLWICWELSRRSGGALTVVPAPEGATLHLECNYD